jgi:hypothetical protein
VQWLWLGWQWYYSIEEISAVRMVLKSAAECDCGSGWVAPKLDLNFRFLWWKILSVMAATPRARGAVAVAGWQWWQSIEESRVVRMVLKSASECDCGRGWVAPKLDLNFWFFVEKTRM